MKRILRTAMPVFLFLTISFATAGSLLAQSSCSDLVGVWEYVLENQEGRFIGTETHGIWLLVDKERSQFENQPPTDVEKVDAFDSMQAAAVTYSCEGNKATVNYLYTKNPNAVGTSFSFEYELDGNELTYWILNEDGSRGAEGHSRRIES